MVLLTLLALLCLVAPRDSAPTGNHLSGTGRMWQISDLHLDPSYHLNSDPSVTCLSSKGVPPSDPGVFGDFLCDAPYRLVLSALEHMGQMVQEQDFIIWTGDSPPHVPPSELSTELVIRVLSNITRTIREHLPHNIRVFPSVGNHDYWPQDQMPTSTNDVYKAAARLWAPWLQQEALSTLTQGGFYSQWVRPGLRVVSLNTILWYGPNEATVNESDPAGQFDWLQNTLRTSELNQEQVYIIGHVPVGFLPFTRNITAMRRHHNERLVQLFKRFSHVIAGQFYGHTHRDSVTVLLDQNGNPVNSAFVAPAVTPIRSVVEPYSNNPGFRLYLFREDDYNIKDLWQYYLNLTEANSLQVALWRLEYVMTEAYGLSDLSPSSLYKLGLSLVPESSWSFSRYFRFFMVSYSRTISCEGPCKLDQVCAVLHMDQTGYDRCVNQGLNRV